MVTEGDVKVFFLFVCFFFLKLEVMFKCVMKVKCVSRMRAVDVFPEMVQYECRNPARTDSVASLWLFSFLWLFFLMKHGRSVGNSVYICPSVFPG